MGQDSMNLPSRCQSMPRISLNNALGLQRLCRFYISCTTWRPSTGEEIDMPLSAKLCGSAHYDRATRSPAVAEGDRSEFGGGGRGGGGGPLRQHPIHEGTGIARGSLRLALKKHVAGAGVFDRRHAGVAQPGLKTA